MAFSTLNSNKEITEQDNHSEYIGVMISYTNEIAIN